MPYVRARDDPDLQVLNKDLVRIVLQERQIYDSERARYDISQTNYEALSELVKNIDTIVMGIARQKMNWSDVRTADGSLVTTLFNLSGVDSSVQAMFQQGPKALEEVIRVQHKVSTMGPSITPPQRKWYILMEKQLLKLVDPQTNLVTGEMYSRAAYATNEEMLEAAKADARVTPQAIYQAVDKALKNYGPQYAVQGGVGQHGDFQDEPVEPQKYVIPILEAGEGIDRDTILGELEGNATAADFTGRNIQRIQAIVVQLKLQAPDNVQVQEILETWEGRKEGLSPERIEAIDEGRPPAGMMDLVGAAEREIRERPEGVEMDHNVADFYKDAPDNQLEADLEHYEGTGEAPERAHFIRKEQERRSEGERAAPAKRRKEAEDYLDLRMMRDFKNKPVSQATHVVTLGPELREKAEAAVKRGRKIVNDLEKEDPEDERELREARGELRLMEAMARGKLTRKEFGILQHGTNEKIDPALLEQIPPMQETRGRESEPAQKRRGRSRSVTLEDFPEIPSHPIEENPLSKIIPHLGDDPKDIEAYMKSRRADVIPGTAGTVEERRERELNKNSLYTLWFKKGPGGGSQLAFGNRGFTKKDWALSGKKDDELTFDGGLGIDMPAPFKIRLTPQVRAFLAASDKSVAAEYLDATNAQRLINFGDNLSKVRVGVGPHYQKIRAALVRIKDSERDRGKEALPTAEEHIRTRSRRRGERDGAVVTKGKGMLKLDRKTGKFGDIDIDLPALSVLNLKATKGGNVILARKNINKDLLNLILGKRVSQPAQRAINDFKKLAEHSGRAITPNHSVINDAKTLSQRLKLLIGHQRAGGDSKLVKKEVTKIAGTLKRQGHLTAKEYGTIIGDYGY